MYLAGAVVGDTEAASEVLGVVRGRLHGSHTGTQLRGHRLLEHAQHLHKTRQGRGKKRRGQPHGDEKQADEGRGRMQGGYATVSPHSYEKQAASVEGSC